MEDSDSMPDLVESGEEDQGHENESQESLPDLVSSGEEYEGDYSQESEPGEEESYDEEEDITSVLLSDPSRWTPTLIKRCPDSVEFLESPNLKVSATGQSVFYWVLDALCRSPNKNNKKVLTSFLNLRGSPLIIYQDLARLILTKFESGNALADQCLQNLIGKYEEWDFEAASLGQWRAVSFLFDKKKMRATMSQTALNAGHIRLAQFIAKKCGQPVPDSQRPDASFPKALHACVSSKNNLLFAAMMSVATKNDLQDLTVKESVTFACENSLVWALDGFLTSGASFSGADKFGNTSLHRIVEIGNQEVITLFLSKKVFFDSPKNNYKKSPFDTATPQIKKFIQEKKKALTAPPPPQKVVQPTSAPVGKKKRKKKKNKATKEVAKPAPAEEPLPTGEVDTSLPEGENVLTDLEVLEQLATAGLVFSPPTPNTNDSRDPMSPVKIVPAKPQSESVNPLKEDEKARIEQYFTRIAGGAWEIVYSNEAITSFSRLDMAMKEAVLKRLAELAEGDRVTKSTRALTHNLKPCQDLALYEANLPYAYRLIWQVEIAYSTKLGSYTEVIKVWDIVKHAFIDKVVNRVVAAKQRTRLHPREKLVQSFTQVAVTPQPLNGVIYPKRFIQEKLKQKVKLPEGYQNLLNSYILEKFYEGKFQPHPPFPTAKGWLCP